MYCASKLKTILTTIPGAMRTIRLSRKACEYLSISWTGRTISPDIALQAEYAYVGDEDDDEGHEPNIYPFSDGLDDYIAPYCADLSAD
jgi:hypothetical protein